MRVRGSRYLFGYSLGVTDCYRSIGHSPSASMLAPCYRIPGVALPLSPVWKNSFSPFNPAYHLPVNNLSLLIHNVSFYGTLYTAELHPTSAHVRTPYGD